MTSRSAPVAGLVAALAAAALLAGCSGIRTVSADVSSFGEWPAGKSPGSYAFERLPSQQARPAETERLENLARPALEKAGFKPAAAGQEPEFLVQVGARTTRTEAWPWDDPLWWRGGFGYWRYGPWAGPSWRASFYYDGQRYEREVAVLIRERASGKPLFEARASNEARVNADATTLGAMFEAALVDFPKLGVNPRSVTVTLPAQS